MVKKILVATESLGSGGVEVSLIRFLKVLSKKKDVSIDLFLLKKEGIYLKDIPKNINILELETLDKIYFYDNKFSYIKSLMGLDKVKFFINRFKLSLFLKFNRWDLYYKELLKHVKSLNKNYDLAIDFLGYGHFLTSFISEKVIAKKKIMWIHDERNNWIFKVEKFISSFDKIFCVSKACLNSLLKNNKTLKNKVDVFYNLVDYENIRKKSLENVELKFDRKKCNIITVGRLEWQKAYDVAVEIAKELKNRNFDFCWYVIGEGTKREEIENNIREYGLENNFILLGIKKNPFPYIIKADLYLQTSRHEGYGLAIAEAKVLGIIPIATNLPCIREQIINNQNGFLCKLNVNDFSNKIIDVYNNKKLMDKVTKNLERENFDFTSEFEKLYKLMEE